MAIIRRGVDDEDQTLRELYHWAGSYLGHSSTETEFMMCIRGGCEIHLTLNEAREMAREMTSFVRWCDQHGPEWLERELAKDSVWHLPKVFLKGSDWT